MVDTETVYISSWPIHYTKCVDNTIGIKMVLQNNEHTVTCLLFIASSVHDAINSKMPLNHVMRMELYLVVSTYVYLDFY